MCDSESAKPADGGGADAAAAALSCAQKYDEAFGDAEAERAEGDGEEEGQQEEEDEEEESSEGESESESESESEAGRKRQPNLAKVELKKPDFFDELEASWVESFNKRMAVDVKDYDKFSQLGKINWSDYALVENEANLCKGHHALCPQIRCRRTGQVYRCKIVSTQRIHFNLTTLGFKTSEYEREIRNSLVERRFLFAFDHPFIRSGIGFFCDSFYNVGAFLEEFPHGTLLDYYEKNSDNKIVCHFEENQVKYLAAQIVLALEYLHCVGCVHRDVQAGNVLVDSRGYVKLTDFAITAALQPGQRLRDVTCFRYYAAPEYFGDNGYGFPVDFYAFGLMLYEMLTRECFSDQEDLFDSDGSIDWGIVPEDLAAMLRNSGGEKCDRAEAAAAAKEMNADVPSAPARGFVDDCLIYDPDYRPDRNSARFYEWFDCINFEQLYKKQLELPWCPEKVVSYQADVDEEYPLNAVLEDKPLPEAFQPHVHLF